MEGTEYSSYPYGRKYKIPFNAFSGSALSNPVPSGSHYKRYIFQAKQNYFKPTTTIITNEFKYEKTSPNWEILSGSNVTGSLPITAPDAYDTYPEQFSSPEVEVTGSIMPMGELFRIHYKNTKLDNNNLLSDHIIS